MKRTDLCGAHLPPGAAVAITGNETYATEQAAQTLTGTAITDAAQLKYDNNYVTGASNTGGLLPQSASPGDECWVHNSGGNTVKIYPATSAGKINGGSAGAALSVATLKTVVFKRIGPDDNWASVLTA